MNYSFRNSIPYAINILVKKIRKQLTTSISYLYAIWWNIQLGEALEFWGIPIMHKHPTGKITIGDAAIFRSAEWSNNIGINRRCSIFAGRNADISIGSQCGFSGTIIAASEAIIIGNRVLCGANCTIVDNDRHPVDPLARTNNEKPEAAPIVIEDDVFLGMNVVVLKGCTIGKGTTVAANSIVTHSLPARVVAGGVPAKIITNLLS